MAGTSTGPTTLVESGMARIEEGQKFLAVSRSHIYGLMDSGALPWAKFGKSRRIPWAALRQYAASCLIGGVQEAKKL